jgi:hypothetical protein
VALPKIINAFAWHFMLMLYAFYWLTLALIAMRAIHDCSFMLTINPALYLMNHIAFAQFSLNIDEVKKWRWKIVIGFIQYYKRN